MNATTCNQTSDRAAGTGPRLGRIGIWAMEFRYGDPGEIIDAAAELEALGFGALWVPGVSGGELLDDVRRLLSGTKTATVATGDSQYLEACSQ
jgi:hypothetical protein